MPSEKFHEEQPLPDDDPIPDDPNQPKEVVEEETVRNNSGALAHPVIGDEKNWALKQNKFPWLWKGQDESAEETEKEEEKKKIPWSSFPLEQEPLHASDTSDDDETEGSSDEESEDSGFEDSFEESFEESLEADGQSLGPFLGLALGSALLGGSLGYCRARYQTSVPPFFYS